MTGDGAAPWKEALLDRLHRVPLDDPRLRARAAAIIADDLAAASWGSRADEVRSLAGRLARGPNGPTEAALLVGGRATRETAAAVTAIAACWDELDGGYRPAAGHGGLYTVPAAVAEAEATDRVLDDLLDAVIMAYEVVAAAARSRAGTGTVHPHSALAPIGAAAAVAWLRHRDPVPVLRAVDVAATLAPRGSMSYPARGALVRNLWAGAGAIAGFLAADAAEAGLTALEDAAEEHALRVDAYAGINAAGWAVLDAYHKPYAACQYLHSTIEATHVLAAGPLRDFEPEEVVEVVVSTHALAVPLNDPHPRNDLAAAFSIPHVVAAVLISGATDPGSTRQDTRDGRLRELRDRVRVSPDPLVGTPPADRPAHVVVELADGRRFEHVTPSARGGPDRPLGLDELAAKVATLTATTHPEFGPVAQALVRGDLDGSTPVREVTAGLSSPSSA